MKKPLKRVARISGIGLQLATTIFLGAYAGQHLDDHYPISEKRIYTLLMTLLALAIGLYNTLRQINHTND